MTQGMASLLIIKFSPKTRFQDFPDSLQRHPTVAGVRALSTDPTTSNGLSPIACCRVCATPEGCNFRVRSDDEKVNNTNPPLVRRTNGPLLPDDCMHPLGGDAGRINQVVCSLHYWTPAAPITPTLGAAIFTKSQTTCVSGTITTLLTGKPDLYWSTTYTNLVVRVVSQGMGENPLGSF